MRRGMDGLASLVQTVLEQDPFAGHLFVFRGRRGDLIKVLWWSGDGMNLYAKRLEHGRFVWPQLHRAACILLWHSCRCCSKASTGGARCARISPAPPHIILSTKLKSVHAAARMLYTVWHARDARAPR